MNPRSAQIGTWQKSFIAIWYSRAKFSGSVPQRSCLLRSSTSDLEEIAKVYYNWHAAKGPLQFVVVAFFNTPPRAAAMKTAEE